MASQKLNHIIDQLQRNETQAGLIEINSYLSKEKNVKKMTE